MMRVATCEETKTNQWKISVLDVSPADLALTDDGYTVRKGATVETVTSATSNGGAKNAKARTKRLANRNDAVVLTDTASIQSALEVHGVDVETSKSTKGAEVFNQADMFDAMDADGAADDSGDDSDLDLDLLGLGWSADQVSRMGAAKKATLVEGNLGPLDIKKTTPPAEPDPPRRRRRRRTRKAKDPEVKVEESAPVKPKRTKRAAAPEVVTSEVKAEEVEPPKRTRKPRASKPRAPKPTADMPAAAPRGYVVHVSRDSWDRVAGEARAYDLGQTPDREEANAIAARWEAAGFTSTIAPLPAHHKARAGKRTVYTGDPVEPILCQHPGCAWAGDHLGPHLKSHDVTLDQYRGLYAYDGEAMVGRAAMALERAHKSVRRRNDLKVGMVVVRIEGDAKVEVWRVEAVDRAGKRLTLAYMNRNLVDTPPEDRTIALSEFFTLFQPVGTWSKRLIRDTKRDWNGG